MGAIELQRTLVFIAMPEIIGCKILVLPPLLDERNADFFGPIGTTILYHIDMLKALPALLHYISICAKRRGFEKNICWRKDFILLDPYG